MTKTFESESGFTIRIRFKIPINYLNIDESEIEIGTCSNGKMVLLKSADTSKLIKDSSWLILISEGWESRSEAENNSLNLYYSLCRSLSSQNLSADCGVRTGSGGFFFKGFLDQLENQYKRKVLNDERGIMIYKSKENPLFIKLGDMKPRIGINQDIWVSNFKRSLKLNEPFTDKEAMAFDLYTMAQKVYQSNDAKFVLLFAALETLLEPIERPILVKNHVDKLIAETRNADLDKKDKSSLIGSLEWLKRHSIRSTARDFLNKHVKNSKFGGIQADELFIKCYEIRNRLLHGQEPHVKLNEISNLVSPLEQMISKLLSGNISNA